MFTDNRQKFSTLPPKVRGILLLTMTMVLVLPLLDLIAKWLATAHELPPAQVAFFRFLFQTVCLGLILWVRFGYKGLMPNNFLANFGRGVVLAVTTLCIFTSVKYMPLADTLAIFFVEPFIVLFLAAVVLKESIGWRRINASLIGFLGAMLVIQPSWTVFGPVSLLPLLAAVLFAVYLLLNKIVGQRDNALRMQFIAGTGGTVLCGFVMGVGEVSDIADLSARWPIEISLWPFLILLGAIAGLGHIMVVQAFQAAPAAALAPFQYLEIASATLLGLWVFGDFPDALTWLGIAIIVGSGLYVMWREGLDKEI